METDEYTLSDQQKLLQRYKRVGGNKGQRQIVKQIYRQIDLQIDGQNVRHKADNKGSKRRIVRQIDVCIEIDMKLIIIKVAKDRQ